MSERGIKLDTFLNAEMKAEDENGVHATRHLVMRCFSLFVCFAAGCTAFSLFSMSSFTRDIDVYFHLSQEEADWVISVNWLGLVCALPVSLLVERMGIRAGAVVSLILPVCGSILLWTASTEMPLNNTSLALFYFFIAGAGGGITFLVAMLEAVKLFSASNRGVSTAIVASSSSVGPLFYMAIYNSVFSGGEAEESDIRAAIQGYLVFTALAFGVVNLFGLAFFGCYTAPSLADPEELHLIRHDSPHTDYSHGTAKLPDNDQQARMRGEAPDIIPGSPATKELRVLDCDREEPLGFCEILGTPALQYMIYSCSIMLGLISMNLSNISAIVSAANVTDHNQTLSLVSAIGGAAGIVILGIVSDRVRFIYPRPGFLLLVAACDIWVFLLGMWFLYDFAWVVLHTLAITASSVVYYSLMPAIFVDEFGQCSFPRVWGLMISLTGLTGFLFNNMLGVLYTAASDPDVEPCIGSSCFRWTFLVAAAASGMCTLFLVLFQREGNKPYRSVPTVR